jgi:hypothetical protein
MVTRDHRARLGLIAGQYRFGGGIDVDLGLGGLRRDRLAPELVRQLGEEVLVPGG